MGVKFELGIASSNLIPDVIPDEKKPLEPFFVEDFEESENEEDFYLRLE